MKQVCLVGYIIFLVLRFTVEKVRSDCAGTDRDMTNLVHKHIGLAESQVWKGKAQTVEHCMQMCIRRTVCNSMNYDMRTTQCELNNGTLNTAQNKTGENLVYSEFNWFPSELDPTCHNRPCGIDEVCIPSNGGPACSYFCMPAGRKVCPMPEKGVRGGRYVGDTNEWHCGIGYVGNDSATCLPSGKWSKEINYQCEPIYGYECKDDTLCSIINGECSPDEECQCGSFNTYDVNTRRCVLDCGAPPDVDNADISGNSEEQTYACINGYIPTAGSEATITCTDTGWSPSNTFSCYEICDPPPNVGGATLSGTDDDYVRTYTCGEDLIPRPGTGNGTISCTVDGWEPEGFECYGIRLAEVNQNGPIIFNYIGFLEVFLDGNWVNIDRDHWTWEATKVACREIDNSLIYGGTHHKDWFGNPNSGVVGQDTKKLNGLDCSGDELSLLDCAYTSQNGNDNHDIVITCFDYDIMDGTNVRLQPNNDESDEKLLIINVASLDGVVCEKEWDDDPDGTVACRTMNLDSSDASKSTTTSSYPIIASGVDCSGTESHLFYCMNRGWGYIHDCDNDEKLQIECG